MRPLQRVSENRLLMYVVYTVVAGAFYWTVFTRFRSYAAVTALAVVTLSLLKDVVVDELYLRGSPAFYRVVEHNPFNYVLVASLLVRFDVSGSVFGVRFGETTLVLLAAIDFLVDLAQDIGVEFDLR